MRKGKKRGARAPVPPEEHQRGGMAKETSSNLFRAFFNLVRGRMSCACNETGDCEMRETRGKKKISIRHARREKGCCDSPSGGVGDMRTCDTLLTRYLNPCNRSDTAIHFTRMSVREGCLRTER